MNTWYRIWLKFQKRDIEKDAAQSVYLYEERLHEAIGTRPVFSPDTNMEDAAIEEAHDCDDLITVQQVAVKESAEALRGHFAWWHLVLWLIFALVVDALGSIHVLRVAGIGLPERVFFGLGLAVLLVVAVAGLFHLARPVEVSK